MSLICEKLDYRSQILSPDIFIIGWQIQQQSSFNNAPNLK